MDNIETQIRQVLAEQGGLSKSAESLAADEDLQQAGMTSYASVNVMLGLEGAFDIEFPDHMLSRSVFATISSMAAAIRQLLG